MDLVSYVKQNNKTHIIFDFDATLFLLVLPWSNWLADVKAELLKYDSSIWDEYERKMMSTGEMQNRYIRNHGDAVREFLNKHSQDFEREQLIRHEPNTDLIGALEQLRDLNLYVWSSNTTPTIMKVLEETNLAHYFKKVISRDDVQYIKPEADGFDLINDDTVPLSNYLMVGDSVHDSEGAKNAGIDFYLTEFFHVGA